ncbi:MAG: tRNA (adenosine(37)-N6)-dimethylallyltransferase MiaA [Eubacteriaceae bacterium]|nr:tRNA (adenosine(37)-N6)-dimethylallyltransferase MiaA [Eubacteriaceae bacterium]
MMKKKILVIAGPTAVGKTEYSIDIAKALDGEIVSCDSMQLYKYMDIGSAKPTPEERKEVRHWLVDEIDPAEDFSVVKYRKMAKDAIEDILSRRKLPIVSGGTGLYLNSLIYDMDFGPVKTDMNYRKKLEAIAKNNGPGVLHNKLKKLDPKGAERIHPNNVRKVIRALEAIEQGGDAIEDFGDIKNRTSDYDTLLIGLMRDREELYQRINMRVMMLIDKGLIGEVEKLMEMGFTSDDIAMKGIGYKEIIAYLNGSYDLSTAIETVQKNTRHYAKRQMTWFNRYEDMEWFDLTSYMTHDDAVKDILKWVEKNR